MICAPLGYEELCAHRSLYELAEGLGRQGVPVLRFDYAGTGDSADPPEGPSLALWRANLAGAIDRLKAETGVTRIVLIGLRFGALMALDAASRSDVARLVLLAPPTGGRVHVRELKLLARIVGPLPQQSDADGLDLGGDRFSGALIREISAFDPAAALERFAGLVLIAGPEPLVPFAAVARVLESKGASVTVRDFPGYGRMMCDPTASRVPQPLLDEVVQWIGPGEAGGASGEAVVNGTITGSGWREEPLVIGDAAPLLGVLTRPDQPTDRAAIWLNTGAIHRIGWGRMSVEGARALAGQGVAVLRLDLAGLGDSAERPRSDERLYAPEARTEVAEAVSALRAMGFARVSLIGHCAGGYQTFEASEQAQPESVVIVNPLCFVWGPSYRLQLSAWSNAREMSMEQNAQEATGEASVLRRAFGLALGLAKALLRNALASSRRAQQIWRDMSGRNPVRGRLQRLTARGARVMMVTSEGDAAEIELARYGGEGGRDFAAIGGVTVERLPPTDHTLSHATARAAYIALLKRFFA